jgi:hypothetical protein
VLKRERVKDYLTTPGVTERKILKWKFRKCDWGLDWTDLAQDRDRWLVLVKAVTNLLVP